MTAIYNTISDDKEDSGQSASEKLPYISIGLPVRDGENYLPGTLDSILSQTFDDFELIISDNASTDRTEEICRELAAKDSRIRYYRNPQNIGAAPNYNRTFELARGRYFKWAAHDDLLAPDYLAKCIEALEQAPEAIVCQTAVARIDDAGELITRLEICDSQSVADRPSKRLAEKLKSYYHYDFFGVIRRDALIGTPLHGPYHHSDIALVGILALRGPTITVPEYAFYDRKHTARYSRSVNPREHAKWHTGSNAKPVFLPAWRVFRDVLGHVRSDVEDPAERLRCYMILLRYGLNLRTVERDLKYLIKVLAPWASDWKSALRDLFARS